MDFFTIGVYNSTEKEFFDKLIQNGIDTFCDIRQRRGVRGAKYSFVNSNRLRNKLEELGIRYCYISELAPTAEIRELQKNIDAEKGELKRDRHVLGKVFVIEYKNKVLNAFDFQRFFDNLDKLGSKKIVLFCVEEHFEACHRSIVAERLQNTYNRCIMNL